MAEFEQERRGAVLVLRINRPEASNALSPAVLHGIGRGMAAGEADPDVRAIVLIGTGDRAFSAGMDLRTGGSAGAERSADDDEAMAAFQRFSREGIDTPVIGAANGTAVGGGFELLMSCDLVVASERARFGLPEVKRALFPAGGGVLLSRRIPLALALELALTGDLIDAARAHELGLVNRVVPADAVLDEAIALAGRVAANGPLGVTAAKRLTRAAIGKTTEEVWALQAELQPGVFGSEDAKEGAAAFFEKRDPVWQGR